VPSEFVAWTPRLRAAKAAALEGRRVRVALISSSSPSSAVVDVAGVMVLDDDEEDDDDDDGSESE
jgi:hypothetical protein